MNPASAAAGPKTAARWQLWTASRTRNAARSRRWRSAAAAGRTPLPSASPLHPHGCEVSLEYSPVLGYPAHPQLLDTVITGMFRAGLSLHTAADLPAEAVRQRVDAALGDLDDIIRGSQRRIHLPRSPRPAPSCAVRG